MSDQPTPPKAYTAFVGRYPKLGEAWETINDAGSAGPLSERDKRLVKLAIAIGAMREGAVRSNVRKALAMGVDRATVEQVVALAASTLGMPSTVAVDSWIQPLLGD